MTGISKNINYKFNFRIKGNNEISKILQNKAKKKSRTFNKKEEAKEEDDRDIDQLLEFIQLDDRKVQDKKKKRKKKRKTKEGTGLEAEVEVQEVTEKQNSTTGKKEEESIICFLCRSPSTSTKLSKCRGCQKVRRHLW